MSTDQHWQTFSETRLPGGSQNYAPALAALDELGRQLHFQPPMAEHLRAALFGSLDRLATSEPTTLYIRIWQKTAPGASKLSTHQWGFFIVEKSGQAATNDQAALPRLEVCLYAE
ncbi:MAG TPA: hypothetical protein VLS48_02250 [Anaerolineales bacterium]|nr:hypothetical protein [Anaerolineales bacterium]